MDEFDNYVAPCLSGLTRMSPGYFCGEVQPLPTVRWPERKLRGILRNGIIMPIEMLPPSGTIPVPTGEFIYEDKEPSNG